MSINSKLNLKQVISATTLALSLGFGCGINSTYAAQADGLTVENSFVREMPPMAPATGAFMLLKNSANEEISIVSAASESADKVELHTHIMDGGVMRMRQTEKISVPANGETSLEPGGLHIMLIKPQPDLVEGKNVEILLNLEDGSTKTISVPVKKMQGLGMQHQNHGHNHGHHH